MAYSSRDNQLLTEAYNLTILKESFHMMTPSQTLNNLDLMSESEHEYVCEVSERIINEFFGGLKGLAKGAGNALRSGKQAVGDAVGGKLQQAGNFAQNVGKGALAAGQQVVDNTKGMYKANDIEAKQGASLVKAQTAVQQLKDLLAQAQQNDLLSKNFDPDNTTLSEIIDYLQGAQQASSRNAQSRVAKGFTGGAGQAFRQGFQS